MFEVAISSISPERFRSILSPERYATFEEGMRQLRDLLAGRVVWNVNSTARGGGVAELLESLVAYARGAGVDARWVVVEGTTEFFAVTKRIHNRLHGAEGDGGALDDEVRATYEQVLADNLPELAERIRRDDLVIVHDPQPAGLVAALRARGATVVWRCHVVTALLTDHEHARRIGERAKERVREEFTSSRSLLDYLHLIASLLAQPRLASAA